MYNSKYFLNFKVNKSHKIFIFLYTYIIKFIIYIFKNESPIRYFTINFSSMINLNLLFDIHFIIMLFNFL